MLKYIQESKEENVTNSDIASIQKLVNKVKRKKEVGINYMKSWEVEEMARREGFDEGVEMISQLYLRLSASGRKEDFERAVCNADYRKQLMEEFAL